MKFRSLYIALCFLLGLWLAHHQALAQTWIEVQDGAWHPNKQILRDIKNNLRKYLRTETHAHNEDLYRRISGKQWKQYKFQYQGKFESEKKYVFINAFCQDFNRNLNLEFVEVLDGGPCFFNLKYNPKTKIFYDLYINGSS